jgi:Trp operon repressor
VNNAQRDKQLRALAQVLTDTRGEVQRLAQRVRVLEDLAATDHADRLIDQMADALEGARGGGEAIEP